MKNSMQDAESRFSIQSERRWLFNRCEITATRKHKAYESFDRETSSHPGTERVTPMTGCGRAICATLKFLTAKNKSALFLSTSHAIQRTTVAKL
ncbi:hypothetical protein Mapa_001503 [Marchantia paleacea]|nr:hypothetical protein Mapa_001503 [Marchantia paleacea]